MHDRCGRSQRVNTSLQGGYRRCGEIWRGFRWIKWISAVQSIWEVGLRTVLPRNLVALTDNFPSVNEWRTARSITRNRMSLVVCDGFTNTRQHLSSRLRLRSLHLIHRKLDHRPLESLSLELFTQSQGSVVGYNYHHAESWLWLRLPSRILLLWRDLRERRAPWIQRRRTKSRNLLRMQ